jgi:Flp pilus assembly protein TadG
MVPLFNNPRRAKGFLRAAAGQAGSSVVEVALLVPFVMLILFGMIDLGRWVFMGIEVTSAARAGAQYGSLSQGNAHNSSAIQTAAQSDVPDFTVQVTSNTTSCWCANAPGTVVTCSTSYPYTACSSGAQITLLQVNTSATYSPWISIPPFNKNFTITGSAMMPTGQY